MIAGGPRTCPTCRLAASATWLLAHRKNIAEVAMRNPQVCNTNFMLAEQRNVIHPHLARAAACENEGQHGSMLAAPISLRLHADRRGRATKQQADKGWQGKPCDAKPSRCVANQCLCTSANPLLTLC